MNLRNKVKLILLLVAIQKFNELFKFLAVELKNNPVLIGEPGVGKTAIAEGLAQRIVNGEVPDPCATNAFWFGLAALIAGAKYRGELKNA